MGDKPKKSVGKRTATPMSVVLDKLKDGKDNKKPDKKNKKK